MYMRMSAGQANMFGIHWTMEREKKHKYMPYNEVYPAKYERNFHTERRQRRTETRNRMASNKNAQIIQIRAVNFFFECVWKAKRGFRVFMVSEREQAQAKHKSAHRNGINANSSVIFDKYISLKRNFSGIKTSIKKIKPQVYELKANSYQNIEQYSQNTSCCSQLFSKLICSIFPCRRGNEPHRSRSIPQPLRWSKRS